METKEIIDILRVCADGDIICSACPRYERSMNYGYAYCFYELMLEADETIESQQKRIAELEAAIREQEERDNRLESDAVKNEPLTLDELRQMDGEPVWVVVSGHTFGWCLVSAECEAVFKHNAGCTFSEIINHGFAYRRKPKEDA